ncbi:MAG: MFS transporter [Micropepsaceae bacterium]
MLSIFRIWWPLLAGVLAIQLGNGLLSTALGLRSDAAGFNAAEIALVMSGLYVGQVIASIVAPRLIAKRRHVPSYVIFGLLAVFSPLAVLISVDPGTWALSRFAFGFGLAGIFVVVESWLNAKSDNVVRGRVFAVYIFVQLTGLLVAQTFVPLLASNLTLSMVVVAGFGVLAILPVALAGTVQPERIPFIRASFRALAAASPVGVAGATISGFVWAVVMAMSPIYAQRAGFDAEGVALFVMTLVAGGIALQLPIGWISDIRDRRTVLAAMAGGAAIAAMLGAAADGQSTALTFVAIALFGGLTFPFYTVAVAHVNDRISAAERLPASGAMILLFGIGSVAGPVAASWAMDAMGPRGFFVLLSAVTAAFAAYTLYRLAIARRSAL